MIITVYLDRSYDVSMCR